MNVYILDSDPDHYQSLDVIDDHDQDILLRTFRGEPIGRDWTPVKVEVLIDDEEDAKLPAGDFPSLGGVVPTFSKRAVDALRDLLEANGEILPLVFEDGGYYAFNTTRVVDALDESRSDIKRFSSGKIMRVVRPIFFPERLKGIVLFTTVQTPGMYVYVTDEFVQRVKKAGLTGFTFKQVWTDEG